MIVKKLIGPIKIDGCICRLSIGSEVPSKILQYWKDNNQIKELLKIGAIEDNKIKNEPIFKSQNRQSKDIE